MLLLFLPVGPGPLLSHQKQPQRGPLLIASPLSYLQQPRCPWHQLTASLLLQHLLLALLLVPRSFPVQQERRRQKGR